MLRFSYMNREKNKKVTLSIDSAIYNSFRQYCEDNAIMLSKKVEIWMSEETKSPAQLKVKDRKTKKFKNKKVTLSINSAVYDKFRDYCEANAIMLSKKVELWMGKELERNKGRGKKNETDD